MASSKHDFTTNRKPLIEFHSQVLPFDGEVSSEGGEATRKLNFPLCFVSPLHR